MVSCRYEVPFISYSGVSVSAVCVYPANNSVEDSTGRFGRNGGVFDIFRTLLVNPNTGTQTTSGYVEVMIYFPTTLVSSYQSP